MPETTTNPNIADNSRTIASSASMAVDPTKNVLDLVSAAIIRQDDLRVAGVTLNDSKIDGLRKEMQALFSGVQGQFEQIEKSRVEQKTDTKVAVDAALSAAEKAVKEQALSSEKAILKSETSAAEQSKLNAATFTAQLLAVAGTLSDVKDRIGRIENVRQGGLETRQTQRADIGTVLGVIGGSIGAITFILFLVSRLG